MPASHHTHCPEAPQGRHNHHNHLIHHAGERSFGRPLLAQANPAAPAMAWLPPAAARLARRVSRERRYGPWKAA